MRTEEDAFADDLKPESAHERAVPSAGCGRLAKALVAAAVLSLLAARCEATSSSAPSSPPAAEMAVLTTVPQTVHPAPRFETTSQWSAAQEAAASYDILHSFTYSDGYGPFAGLIQATDGNFYGTALYGGVSNYGTAFKMDASGNLTILHSFAYSDGAFPWGGLMQATDGNFYGTTTQGGAGQNGVVFRLSFFAVGAKVSGKGSIPIPGGDATFEFVGSTATGDVSQGSMSYRDHVTGMTVKSTVVTAVQVTGTHGRMFGKATIEGSGSYDFIVDVDDQGEPGTGVDKFGIQLSNGYVRSGTLSSGNIQIHK